MAVHEAIGMTSALIRMFYEDISGLAVKAHDKKNAAIAYGVMVDKLNALTGRPTQIHAFADAEKLRPGLRELGLAIAQSNAPRHEPTA